MLKTELINEDNLSLYMPYMLNDEIFGCIGDRYTVIGIRDDEQECPVGLCTIEILPEYIRLQRIFINENSEKNQILSLMLETLRSMIAESGLPVYTFAAKSGSYMKKMGFEEEECAYTYKMAALSDLKDIPLQKKNDMNILLAENVPKEEFMPYIYHMGADRFIQFPYADFDVDIFTSSLVCKTQNEVTAFILVDETDKYIGIPKIFFKNIESLDACFFVLKKMLREDYPPDSQLVFINSPRDRKDIPDRYFKNITELPMKVLKLSTD